MRKTISIIAAVANSSVIGNKGKLPWKLPADMKRFRDLTFGHCVAMGRKTYESIGKPLPGRSNIIITRDRNYRAEGCNIANTVHEAIAISVGEIFFLGGGEIYREVLPFANRIYLTKIYHDLDGDTYFPDINFSEWKEVHKSDGIKDARNPYNYSFFTYERI